jgi:hypothetical protein
MKAHLSRAFIPSVPGEVLDCTAAELDGGPDLKLKNLNDGASAVKIGPAACNG